MKKTEKLGEATSPDGSVLSLIRHDGAYTIRVNGVELMSTRRHQSETALATLVCDPIAESAGARVLIGGLGLGFTLREALRILRPDAVVDVAELVPEVVAWNREPEFGLALSELEDPRTTVHMGDVADLLRANRGVYDAIMLDVDNGPASLITKGNAGLYRELGIATAVAALQPRGRIAYWSAQPEPKFAGSLRGAGLRVAEHSIRAHVTSGGYYTILVGERTSARTAQRAEHD
jgi:spermidine synthase